MSAPILLDFHDQSAANKSLKKVAQYMQRAGQPVASFDFNPAIKRTSGVSYREALLTLVSGQTVTLRVTQSGDVFQVALNGSVRPIKNAANQVQAIAEIADMAKANQTAFQRRQARVKVELPKGIKTAAPRMEVVLADRVAQLDAQIAERTQQVAELQAELTDTVLDSADDWPRLEGDGNRYARDQYEFVPSDIEELPGTMVLREGAEPVRAILDNAEEDAEKQAVEAALLLAESISGGTVLDSADMGAAKATLQNALNIVETNSVINMGEGNLEQADLERANAESFRAALAVLDSSAEDPNEPPIPEPEEPEPSKAGDEAIAAAAKFQFEEEDGKNKEPID